MAVAVLLGGAYAVAAVAMGARWVAEGSFPLAFGFDQTGDTSYPFPEPAAVWLGLGCIAFGAGLAVSLVAAARGSTGARWAAAAGLLAVIVACWAIAGASATDRRCAVTTYTGVRHCTSRTAASARDTTILALPAAGALLCLARGRPRRGGQAGPRPAGAGA